MDVWHCYEWVGSGAEIADDAARNTPSSATPPNVVRDWLRKPDRLRQATCKTVDEAVDWLSERITRHAPNGLGGDRSDYEKSLTPYSRERLELGRDVVRSMWLTGGRALRLAVINAGLVDADSTRTAEALSPSNQRDTDLDYVGTY